MASTLPSLALLRHTSAPSPIGNFTNPWAAEMRDREAGGGGGCDTSGLQRALAQAQAQAEKAKEVALQATQQKNAAEKNANRARATVAKAQQAQKLAEENLAKQREIAEEQATLFGRAVQRASQEEKKRLALQQQLDDMSAEDERRSAELKEKMDTLTEANKKLNDDAQDLLDDLAREEETTSRLQQQTADQRLLFDYFDELWNAFGAYSDNKTTDAIETLKTVFGGLVQKMEDDLLEKIDELNGSEPQASDDAVDDGSSEEEYDAFVPAT